MGVWMLLVGLVLLVAGGELLVRGAVAVANRLGVSPLLIGLTLVGFGTSTPELLTSIDAALAGSPGIAVGNVVGSNTANILLILGLAALVRPLVATPAAFRRDGSVLALASLACLAVVAAGAIGRATGFAFVVCLLAYVCATTILEHRRHGPSADLHAAEAEAAPSLPGGLALALAAAAAGLALTLGGAGLFVDGAIELARGLGVSETLVGLTVVAVGTSLPELVTSVAAARRGQGDLAFGNVVGSNIYNILGILGATALVRPMAVPLEIARFDIWVMLAATAGLLAATLIRGRVARLEGALLLGAYGVYATHLALGA